jgi:hypothetical protein
VIQNALSITESQISDLDHTVAWGADITGDINDQTDLIELLNQYSAYKGTQIIDVNYYWVTGYTYHVGTVSWLEDGVFNSTNFDQNVVLSTADPTDPRIDRVVLNYVSDTVYDVTGTPASEPAPPELDGDELELFFVSVPINAPPAVSNLLVYDENTQEVGGEWDTTVSGSVVTNSTIDPSNGTVHVTFTSASSGDYVRFDHSIGSTAADGFVLFNFKQPSVHNFRFSIIAVGGGFFTPIATAIQSGYFGINGSVTTWQTVAVPFTALPTNTTGLVFNNTRNNSTIYFDEIYIQSGVEVPQQPINLALNDLTDVNTSGVTDGQGITFDSATGLWVATTLSGSGESTTVSDTAEIDLTLTGSDITADIVTGSIDETKLDASVNASLDLADTSVQSVTGGTGVSSSGGTTPTIALTVDELAEKSGNLVGTDRLVGTTETTNWAETISNIPLSVFNNDLTNSDYSEWATY